MHLLTALHVRTRCMKSWGNHSVMNPQHWHENSTLLLAVVPLLLYSGVLELTQSVAGSLQQTTHPPLYPPTPGCSILFYPGGDCILEATETWNYIQYLCNWILWSNPRCCKQQCLFLSFWRLSNSTLYKQYVKCQFMMSFNLKFLYKSSINLVKMILQIWDLIFSWISDSWYENFKMLGFGLQATAPVSHTVMTVKTCTVQHIL